MTLLTPAASLNRREPSPEDRYYIRELATVLHYALERRPPASQPEVRERFDAHYRSLMYEFLRVIKPLRISTLPSLAVAVVIANNQTGQGDVRLVDLDQLQPARTDDPMFFGDKPRMFTPNDQGEWGLLEPYQVRRSVWWREFPGASMIHLSPERNSFLNDRRNPRFFDGGYSC